MRFTTARWTAGVSLCITFGMTISAAAQNRIVSFDFFVTTADGVSIHVHRKTVTKPRNVPLLLIHGTWGAGRTWDFPDRQCDGPCRVARIRRLRA
jgi:pimeloyl-ACP methyl ester carboxylesterase